MKNDNLKFKMTCCIFMTLFALIFLWSGPAEAADGDIQLFVAPKIFELKVQKGETIKNKIKIYNRGQNPVALEAIVDDFGAEEESGTINFGSTEKDQAGEKNMEDISQWIKITNPNFILDPEEQENIDFTVSVPKNVSDGGKYGVIFFQPRITSERPQESSVKILPKVGVLFLLSVGDVELGKAGDLMSLAEFNIPENFHLKKIENLVLGATGLFQSANAGEKSNFSIVETGEMSFNLRLKNNDIYHIKPGGKLAIVSGSGKILGETEISKTTILPGKVRKIPVEFKPQNLGWFQKYLPVSVFNYMARNLVWGKYEARLSLNTDAGAAMNKSIVFWIFPWKTVLLLIFMVVTFVLVRKRIILAVRALFKPIQIK